MFRHNVLQNVFEIRGKSTYVYTEKQRKYI